MTDFFSIVASIVSIAAGLITITPILKDGFSKNKSVSINITNNYNSSAVSKKRYKTPNAEEESYFLKKINQNYKLISKFRVNLIGFSIFMTTAIFIYAYFNSSNYFIFSLIENTVYKWLPHKYKAYLLLFTLYSSIIYFSSKSIVIYFHDKALRLELKKLNFTEDRIKKLRTKLLNDKKINSHHTFPISTLSIAINNIKIDAHNKRASSDGEINTKAKENFWFQERILIPYILIIFIYFIFNYNLSNNLQIYSAQVLDEYKNTVSINQSIKLTNYKEGSNFHIISSDKEFFKIPFYQVKINESTKKFYRNGQVTGPQGGNLRYTPYGNSDIKENIILKLQQGEVLSTYGENSGEWFLVLTHDGQQGFIHKDYFGLIH